MIERIKMSWRLFKGSKPGLRFRERYRRHQKYRSGRFDPARILYVGVGILLIVASVLFGWLPVLGLGTVFLGLGMIAGEFKPVARFMDWLEVRLKSFFKPVGKAFSRLPTWAQLLISLVITLLSFSLVYGAYRLIFGA